MRLQKNFYKRDVLEVAPELLGKKIIRLIDGQPDEYFITEVEAYRGVEDMACHACKGRTARTEMLFHEGGHVYVYFIYGMYWMLNIVTGKENEPQAALIRSVKGIRGPGRVARDLNIDRSFYGESLITSDRIWLEDGVKIKEYHTGKRIGVEYAGPFWKDVEWRFFVREDF